MLYKKQETGKSNFFFSTIDLNTVGYRPLRPKANPITRIPSLISDPLSATAYPRPLTYDPLLITDPHSPPYRDYKQEPV
jgi:hypothetical protein